MSRKESNPLSYGEKLPRGCLFSLIQPPKRSETHPVKKDGGVLWQAGLFGVV